MASGRPSKWQLFKIKWFPFLYKKCPAGNYHPKKDKYCMCRVGEYSYEWRGGVYDFSTGKDVDSWIF